MLVKKGILSETLFVNEPTQIQYDEAMFLFSQENYSASIRLLESILQKDPMAFEARLSLGMAYCRMGDLDRAILEGHLAEKIQPNEALVHTNLSLFYVKKGDREKAEHHGLSAKIASWKKATKDSKDSENVENVENADSENGDLDSELSLAKPKPKIYKTPEKFPEMPWKK